MKKFIAGIAAVCALGSATAFASPDSHTATTATGEFGNYCAMDLAMGREVHTTCTINWMDPTTKKTYCFSTEAMKNNWAKDPAGNLAKATTEYGKLHAAHAAHETATKKM